MRLLIDNQAHLYPASHLPGAVLNEIKRRLTFTNPQWEENERRGFSNWQTPQELCYLEDHGARLTMPRGFSRQLVGILQRAGVQYRIDDHRGTLVPVDFTFKGELHPFQTQAVEAVLSRDFGSLAAPPGSGKTIMALALIAMRRQPALIVVHTRELMEQWISRIETFLGIPAGQVGRIGGGKMVVGDRVSVGLVQSLYQRADEIAPYVGHLVVDECHRAPSRTFTEAVSAFDCRYMTGLSATPWRRDGLSRLIYWYLGDKVHEVDQEVLEEAGHVLRAEVIWRPADFEPTFDGSTEYSQMLSELTKDPARNALLAADVAQEAQGNAPGGLPGTE